MKQFLITIFAVTIASLSGCNNEAARQEAEVKNRLSDYRKYRESFQETVDNILAGVDLPSSIGDFDQQLRQCGVQCILVYSDLIVFEFYSKALDSRRAIVYRPFKRLINTKNQNDLFHWSIHRQNALGEEGWSFIIFD